MKSRNINQGHNVTGLKNLLLAVLLVLAMVAPSLAASNNPPPTGAILDLNGQAVPHDFPVQYTVDFIGTLATTAITFAFRNDASFTLFTDASVVDVTTSSGNLLTNGDFSGGVHTSNGNTQTPIGWTYANIFGATFGGFVIVDPPGWFDGAEQAYDAISQPIPTNIGDTYRISFDVSSNSPFSTFSDLSTNGNTTDTGGNGIDVLAYAQAGLPPAAVPEPVSLLFLGAGLVGMAVIGRKNRKEEELT